MKKKKLAMPESLLSLILIGVFLFLLLIFTGSASANIGDDVIIALSSDTNAHAELYNKFHYTTIINYTEIFGWPPADNPHLGPGIVLRLSSNTNAHAQIPKGSCIGFARPCKTYNNVCYTDKKCIIVKETSADACNNQTGCYVEEGGLFLGSCKGTAEPCGNFTDEASCLKQDGCVWKEIPDEGLYSVEVKYSDLKCRATDSSEDCFKKNEKCIVRLSDWTNAHLETCDNSNYPIQICCSSEVPCSKFTTKNECWKYSDCAWTPIINETGQLTTSNADGGGCCKIGWRWDPDLKECKETFAEICNNPWTSSGETGDVTYNGSQWFYCAQVTSEVSTGYWYPIEKY